MPITQITDHAGEARARLAHQFRDKPNLVGIVNALGAQAQDLEDALWALIDGRTLANSTGATLDLVGGILGRARPVGMGDGDYRALLYAQIVINTSYGMTETVYQLLRLLGAEMANIREPGGYSMIIQYRGVLLLNDAGLLAAIIAATPPVSLSIVEYGDTPFGFDGDPEAFGFGVGELARSVT